MRKLIGVVLFFLSPVANWAQLGFCPGSKGEPVFTENFGNGTTYGPALPAGITTYPFVTGAPNDGFYTLYYQSSLYSTWHYSLDHTPDATDGPNGKMFIVNANAATSGDFYKKTVTGLCANTTFEFSAWLMNVYNPNTNYCGAGQIPINVRFEIWNATETVLLGSGNTGNIMGSSAPLWQQFALVFTTVSDTSVVLKMKNNGLGGCGNDLAIDDISFSACGDLTTVSSPSAAGTTFATCTNPVSVQLNATTAGGIPYFYQWQSSPDNTVWTDVPGANSASFTTPNLTATTYYRVKAAQDAANLGNSFCSTISNVFTVSILAGSTPPVSSGNHTICSGSPFPALSVIPSAGATIDWYDAATGGNLVLANSLSYTPTAAGTYYAQGYNSVTGCIASPRTAVTLSVVATPSANVTAPASVCSGNTATVNFSGTPNAIVAYNVNGGAGQTLTLNASGTASITTPTLTSNTTYNLESVSLAGANICLQALTASATITVSNSLTAGITATATTVCSGNPVSFNFSGTAGATVGYSVSGGPRQTLVLNASGTATIAIPNATANVTYSLLDVTLGTCTATVSQSATVSVVALPTASISASPALVCANQTAAITFTGTPNAMVTYDVNGGAHQNLALGATGSATLTSAPLTVNTSYNLVSVALIGPNACSQMLTGSAMITVKALPNATLSTTTPTVCTGNAATVSINGTAGATVQYSVNGGAISSAVLDGSGNASIALSSLSANAIVNLSSIVSGGCTRALSQSLTVNVTAVPTASISATPTAICAGQASTVHFTGTPNGVVSYTVGGAAQSITLDGTGSASVATLPLSAGVTYQLTGITLSAGCGQALSGATTIGVNALPNATYTGALQYCTGDTVLIDLFSTTPGATFNWTVAQNGTMGATSGTGNQILQPIQLTSNTMGTVVYTVTPYANGCPGNPVVITVEVYPIPQPQLTGGVICVKSSAPSSTQFYTLDSTLSAADHTFQWFFEGTLIPGATGATYHADDVGTYSVIATNSAGCVSAPVFATVGQMAQGEALVIEQSEAFSDAATITVNVVGGGGPFSYQLDHGPFQPAPVFTNVPQGTHTIHVKDDFCTDLTTEVTVIDYPHFFTPNGDGYNDRWNIAGLNGAVIEIFDRYGKLLKQISSDGAGWDGTYNGQAVPASDYWFVVKYDEAGARKTFKAHFAIKR